MIRPSITALETFVAVARHRSFRKAAAERGISASALSHIIRDLETSLGIRLFNRTNRTVRITAAGEQFLHRVAPALDELTEAYEQINTLRDKPRGTLRLNVPRSAAELVIRPLLGRFMSEYPDITLEVVTNDGLVDIVAAGFDAGIRITERLEQDMIAVPVGPQRRFAVVGTPSYFADRSVPRHPGELHNHACIGRSYPSGVLRTWTFAKDAETYELTIRGPLIVDEHVLMLQGALDGVGIAYVYESLVEEYLREGSLIRVLEDWCPIMPGFFLCYHGRRHIPATLRAFIEVARPARHQIQDGLEGDFGTSPS